MQKQVLHFQQAEDETSLKIEMEEGLFSNTIGATTTVIVVAPSHVKETGILEENVSVNVVLNAVQIQEEYMRGKSDVVLMNRLWGEPVWQAISVQTPCIATIMAQSLTSMTSAVPIVGTLTAKNAPTNAKARRTVSLQCVKGIAKHGVLDVETQAAIAILIVLIHRNQSVILEKEYVTNAREIGTVVDATKYVIETSAKVSLLYGECLISYVLCQKMGGRIIFDCESAAKSG